MIRKWIGVGLLFQVMVHIGQFRSMVIIRWKALFEKRKKREIVIKIQLLYTLFVIMYS